MFTTPRNEMAASPVSGKGGFSTPENEMIPEDALSKTIGNILPDIGQTAVGLAGLVKEGAYDMPKRALETGLEMASGTPYAETPSGRQDVGFVEQAPEMAAEMIRPVTHPVQYMQEHPVQQTLNVLGLGSAAKGLIRGLPKSVPRPKVPAGITAAEASTPLKEIVGRRLASKITAQAFNINPSAVKKLAAKAGMSPEDIVLELGDKANQFIPNLIEVTDSANSKFSKVLNAQDQAGKSIGRIVDQTTVKTGGIFPEAQSTIDALKKAAVTYKRPDGGEIALQKTAERLEGLQNTGKLDFDQLQQFKSDIGESYGQMNVPPGTDEIYGILSDGIDDVISRVHVENPAVAKEFPRLKEIYSVTSKLLPAMMGTASKEVTGASMGGGLFSKMIPGAIGGAVGGLPGALAGAGVKYLQEAIAPDLFKNLAYKGMKASPRVGLPSPSIAGIGTAANIGSHQNQSDELEDYLISRYGRRQR